MELKMNNAEKKVDELADLISKALEGGGINSVLIESIKTLESQLTEQKKAEKS
jgi:hypothetical protein